eukprot:g6194.t1
MVAADFPKMNTRKRKRAIVFVYLTVVIDFLGLMLTIPILANFARLVQGEPAACVVPGALEPMKAGNNGYCGNATHAAVLHGPAVPSAATCAANSSHPFVAQDCDGARTDVNANVGLISTSYAVATLISSLWMPKVSDTYGRRLAFFLSLIGSAAGFSLMAVSNSFEMLIAVRFLAGLFGGSATVANSYITDVYAPQERGAMFARLGATIISTVSLGPTLGAGLASAFGLRGPLWVATALSALALACAYAFVLEPAQLRVEREPGASGNDAEGDKNPLLNGDGAGSGALVTSGGKANDVGAPAPAPAPPAQQAQVEVRDRYNPWCVPFNLAIGLQTFLATVAFNGISSLLALLLQAERYGVVDTASGLEQQGRDMSAQIALNALTISLCTLPSMILLFPILTKRHGLLRTGTIGQLFFGVALFFVPRTAAISELMPTLALLGLANGLQSNVSTQSLASRAPPKHVAQTLAVGTLCDSAAGMVGPLLTQLYRVSDTFPYTVAAACAWLGALTLLFVSACIPGAASIGLAEAEKGAADAHAESASEGERGSAAAGANVVLGVPDLSEANERTLIKAMFKGAPGKDYSEQFARDFIALQREMFEALRARNHLIPFQRGVQQLTLEGKPELHERVMVVHRELIQQSFPHLTDDPERKQFKQDIYDMLMGLGHDEWAANIPGVQHDTAVAKKVILTH